MEREFKYPLVIEVDFHKDKEIIPKEWFLLSGRKCRLLYTDSTVTMRYGRFEYEDGEKFTVTYKISYGTIDHDIIYWNRIVGWSLCSKC
ncbi:hypothetical protein [Citrobacter phage Ci1]|nr:hypothetical protein [Citrobacter phage Ci1]